jgi:hypothetical protein
VLAIGTHRSVWRSGPGTRDGCYPGLRGRSLDSASSAIVAVGQVSWPGCSHGGALPLYQDLIVPLPETCQTLLRIVWHGLLLQGRATQKSHPLRDVSRGQYHGNSVHERSPSGLFTLHLGDGRVVGCKVGRAVGALTRLVLCNQLCRAPPRERVSTFAPTISLQHAFTLIDARRFRCVCFHRTSCGQEACSTDRRTARQVGRQVCQRYPQFPKSCDHCMSK